MLGLSPPSLYDISDIWFSFPFPLLRFYNSNNLLHIFDEKVENKGSCDDISQLLKGFIAAKSMAEKDFNFKLNGKEFWFGTKTVKPALDFVKTLMNDKTEINFNDDNLKLDYNSEFKPLRFTFSCLNDLTVQILITPMRKR